MSSKKSLEDEINEFLAYWDREQMHDFLCDIMPIFELYDVEENDDWVNEAVGDENTRNVRLIRTVYLVSRLAEAHAAKLALIKTKFRNLFNRMEQHGTIERKD